MNLFKRLTISLFALSLLALFQTSQAQQKQGATIGGYGELHYNDIMYNENGENTPGKLDFHRFILYAGYQFNDWISFTSELELEHTLIEAEDNGEAVGGEVALEQAYVDLRVKPQFGVRAGLMLVPVGIVNPTHEPPAFHGVERPNVEKYLIPSTWRESGIGIYGNNRSGLSYQVYAMAGLKPNGINGKNGIRGARQSAFESTTGNFALTGRLDYRVNLNLQVGLSYFFSTLSHEIDDGNAQKISSLEGDLFNMVEGHVLYTTNRFEARGLFVFSHISDSEALNNQFNSTTIGGSTVIDNGTGGSHLGGYAEVAYDLLPFLVDNQTEQKLFTFARFETYNTQLNPESFNANPEFERYEYTAGFTYKPTSQVAFKADYQMFRSAGEKNIHQLNLGVGYNF